MPTPARLVAPPDRSIPIPMAPETRKTIWTAAISALVSLVLTAGTSALAMSNRVSAIEIKNVEQDKRIEDLKQQIADSSRLLREVREMAARIEGKLDRR